MPENLDAALPTYTHVIVATGIKIVFIAGQEPEDAHGNLVSPGDLAAQARQVFANLGRALAACDARPGQVAKIGVYVVHHRPEYLPVIVVGGGLSGVTYALAGLSKLTHRRPGSASTEASL